MVKSIGKANFEGNVRGSDEMLSESMGKKGSYPFNNSAIPALPKGVIVSSITISEGTALVSGKQCAAAKELRKAGFVPDWSSHPVGVGARPLALYDVTIDTTAAVGEIWWG
jgi:hypothetical protein